MTDRPEGRTRRVDGAWPSLALALAGGVLVAFSLPPWGWWPLAWIGIAVYYAAHGLTTRARNRFGCGFVFGFAWLTIGTAWMWQLTMPGYIVAGFVFGLYHAVAAVAVPAGSNRARPLSLPVAHTLVETLRLSFPFGGVPLATLGISQVAGPLAPIARVGGVIAITWVTFQLGMGVAALVRLASERRRATTRRARAESASVPVAPRIISWSAAGLPSMMIGVALLVAFIAPFAPDGRATGESLTIAAVQGGGEQGTRAIDVSPRLVTEAHLEATSTIEPDPDLDLVLWPENTIDVTDFAASDEMASIVQQAQRLDVPISVGITEDVPDRPGRVTNAQVVVAPDGEITSRYDKVRRVPFGEYVPLEGLLKAFGAPVDQVPTNAVPGTTPAVLELPDGHRTGVVISWEVFFGGRAREGIKHGAEVITNPTNGASYSGTIVQTQQVASSRLRAIETGRWVVQAAPTGFTAIVSASGEVRQRTGVSEQKVLTADVPLRSGHTWYVSLGDGPFIVVLALGFALATIATVRSRRALALAGQADSAPDAHRERLASQDAGRGPAASGLDHERDRAVVDEADPHLVPKVSRGDDDAGAT